MKSRFLSLFLAVIAATVLSSCEDHHASQMLLLINGVQYDIDLPATDPVDLKTLCTEFDAYIQVVNYTDFERIAIDGGTMARSSVTLPVPELSQDEQITIDYKTGRLTGTIVLNTLHSGIDRIGATGRAVVPGDFYLSFIFRRLIMKYDNAGQLLYYCFDPDAKDGTMEENGFWDFKKHTYNGKTYYSYHAPDPAFAKRAFTGYNPGMRVLLDEHYRPLKSIHAKASRDGYLPDGEPIDGHDFYFFSPDHYILSLYVEREVQGRLKCVSYLQEVDNGEVVFDWWSTDHPEMAQWGDYTFDFSYDYVHFNSLQVLPDGNWLCSFRHLSSVVKIDRAGGTGDIIWRISGKDLPDAQSFSGEHYVTLHEDGTLSLFDNGNGHTPPITRIMRLEIDPETGEVKGGGNLVPTDDYFSMACGAVNDFGSYFVVGWGWRNGEWNNRLVTEHARDGREIFGLRHISTDSMANSLSASYRCVKY